MSGSEYVEKKSSSVPNQTHSSLQPQRTYQPEPIEQETSSIEEQLERASQFGYNGLDVPVNAPATPPPPVQRQSAVENQQQPQVEPGVETTSETVEETVSREELVLEETPPNQESPDTEGEGESVPETVQLQAESGEQQQQKPFLQAQLERASQFGYNGLDVPVNTPGTPSPRVQRKLTLDGLDNEYQPEVIERANPVLNGLNQFKVQRLCDECEAELADKEDKHSVQAKLEVGQPGDKYEQEADAVTAQVVHKINAPTTEPSVQRQPESKSPAPLLDEAPNSPAYQAALEAAIKVNQSVALGKKQLNAGGLLPFVSFLKGSLTFDKKKSPDVQKELAKELAPKLAAWQRNNGLTANGQLDAPTLEKLKDIRYGRKDWTQQDADEQVAIEAAKKQANDLKADPNSSVRAAIVSLAASQIGQVNNLNRRDGKKYGWERVKAFYDTAIPSYSSNPANLKRIQASGPPEEVGAWSWCGIFAIWAVKSVTGNGSWEQGKNGGSPAGLVHVPKAADPTLANARPGDILYIAKKSHHFMLAEPVSGDTLVTIDGAQDYEGINRTTHPLSEILGYYRAVQEAQPSQQPATEEGMIQRQPESETATELNATIMRQSSGSTGGEASVTQDVEQGIQQAKGGGQGLDESVRQPMEQAFGADFSGVKIHTDAQSDQLNRSIQAKAFTTGQDIFFKQGEYQPGSRGGQELLAHELTHVVQQRGEIKSKSSSEQPETQRLHQVHPGKKTEFQHPFEDSVSSETIQSVTDDAHEEQVKIGSVYQGLPSLQPKKGFVNTNSVSGNQLIQRLPNPNDAHTFRAGLSPVGAIYKNTYNGSASTTIKTGWEAWSFERRWQLYDANDKLLDESYYTIPQPTYKIDKRFVLIGTAGGYEKPWSIWLKVTKTLVPFGGSDKNNFPHSYITFPVFNTPLDDTKAHKSKAEEQENGLGIAVPKGKSPTSPANTNVTPDTALKILENVSRGEPPFKPELGKAGCSWFVTEGNPYTGIDATKSINIPVDIVKNAEKVVIDPAKLNELFAEMLAKTDAEAETTWRTRNNKVGKTLTPAQERQLGDFKERFAESRMWDRVGEIIRSSKDKVGEVIVEKGRFSRTGAGKFAVVADAKMIQVKGGIPSLLTILNDAGISAEPVVVEAAEALAKKQKYAGQVRGVFRIGGRILLVVAVAADLYKIYYAEDKLKATITSAGGWAGATAAGAAFAAWFTPADTAGPWAWVAHGVGTLVAGGIGYWVGSETIRYIYELVPAN